MAESYEAEVEYCSEHLNVRKEVKIVFQGKREREIFYQSCKVQFIAFQANERSFIYRAAYKRMCMLYHPDKYQDPATKKVRLKKLRPCLH